jgi:hypothetical protein
MPSCGSCSLWILVYNLINCNIHFKPLYFLLICNLPYTFISISHFPRLLFIWQNIFNFIKTRNRQILYVFLQKFSKFNMQKFNLFIFFRNLRVFLNAFWFKFTHLFFKLKNQICIFSLLTFFCFCKYINFLFKGLISFSIISWSLV